MLQLVDCVGRPSAPQRACSASAWHENSEHIDGGDSLQPDCARNCAKSLKAF
jgi:hypothetical protein